MHTLHNMCIFMYMYIYTHIYVCVSHNSKRNREHKFKKMFKQSYLGRIGIGKVTKKNEKML